MSQQAPAKLKETERIEASPGGPGRGPFGGGMVGQKASTFVPSAKRLFARMAPDRFKALAVVALAVVSVTLTAVGPKVLGHATDLIFSGPRLDEKLNDNRSWTECLGIEPGEILVAVAVTDSGRPLPRVGGLQVHEIEGEDGLR